MSKTADNLTRIDASENITDFKKRLAALEERLKKCKVHDWYNK